MLKKLARSLFLPAILCIFVGPALMTGCDDGSDGSNGPTGPTGPTGPSGWTCPSGAVLCNAAGSGAYVSQGTATESTATKGGLEATCYTGTSATNYGNTNLEVQFSLDAPTDISGANYTLTYDLWISSSSENLSMFQASAWNAGYQPKYWDDLGGADHTLTEQWQPVSILLDPAGAGYVDAAFDPTAVAMIRIKGVTGEIPDSAVEYCLKNIAISAPE